MIALGRGGQAHGVRCRPMDALTRVATEHAAGSTGAAPLAPQERAAHVEWAHGVRT